jgi:glycosyltransferase involved in cell wall biosynthesis
MSGGERYVLTLASYWSKTHDVALFWDDPNIVAASEKRLHIDLSRVRTVENVFKTKNIFKKLAVSRGYDLIFFLTDGSVPTTFARRNILHFQVPFAHINVHPITLTRFQAIVCNSRFTKEHIDPRIGKRSIVVYPPVEPIAGKQARKKNIILSVGRFHPVKKQDILIEIFRKIKGLELVLAGGLQPADKSYFESLQMLAKGLPVRFFPNASFDELTKLYNESLLYWHAAGYGSTRPEDTEHFGISTVEAMSAGCIPVVFNGGGLPEIVQTNLWNTPEECVGLTEKIIKQKANLTQLQKDMIARSKKFSVAAFTDAFDTVLTDIIQ